MSNKYKRTNENITTTLTATSRIIMKSEARVGEIV